MDTGYLFQKQILPVSLSDALPKSLVPCSCSYSVFLVCIWLCGRVHNQVPVCKKMSIHVHILMWMSEMNLVCCFSGADKFVFRDRA